ncbi:MAG: hypothetical protein OEU92_30900 [Alphaproteobacteria bacterium]|nr:hypothetical protein [Alphaproteobacteria bacterium]
MTDTSTLHRHADALAEAKGLIDEVKSRALSINQFNAAMTKLWEANRDLQVLRDARSDPWDDGDGPAVAKQLAEVEKQIRALAG